MNHAMSLRQAPLAGHNQRVHRRFTCCSSHRTAQLCSARSQRFISIRCQAGVQPSQTSNPASVPYIAPAPPSASVPVYSDAPVVQNEYVVPTTQPLAPSQPRPQEYYMAPPPPPMYPVPAYREAQQASGLPWFVWVGVGILATTVFGKISEIAKKGPQQMMAEMAMKQMMGAMSQQQGGAAASPFGATGSPFGAAANPYAGNPFAGFTPPQAASSTVDTTATQMPSSQPASAPASTAPSSTASASSSSGRGEKFSQRINAEGRIPDNYDVVEPEVKEPPPMGAPTPATSAPKSSFFKDVDTTAEPTPTPNPAAASPSSNAQASNFSGDPATGNQGDASAVTVMMEKMLRNPEMQKMLYPYLPEPMRNPQSIEWMLDNPEVKAQMEKMLTDQGFNMPPQMVDMMKNMDLSEDKVNRQFQELGMRPEDVMQKVMSSPDLAAGFSNPKVQAAIMDISSNPMNIVKYQSDPEIMKVLEKVNEIFAPSMPMPPK